MAASLSLRAGDRQEATRKPEVFLIAIPSVAFAPARIKFTVDLRDGADDYEEFYCASVEWDWDDGTVSQWTRDCEPYRAGRSRIQRTFSAVHTYDLADEYQPKFRLKKRGRIVAQVGADIEVHSGRPESATR
jgi:hypothetical protein